MMHWWLLFAICTVSLVIAEHGHEHDDDDDDDDNESDDIDIGLFRKAICDKNSTTLFADLDACLELETELSRNITTDCALKVNPSSEGKVSTFSLLACKDNSLFEKMDDCFTEYDAYKHEMEAGEKAIACYQDVIKKYEIEELANFFNTTHSSIL